MEVTVNLSDIASLLAHAIVRAKFEDDDNYMYEVITDTEISYIKEAQDLFDEWYDYYYKLINNLKIN